MSKISVQKDTEMKLDDPLAEEEAPEQVGKVISWLSISAIIRNNFIFINIY